MTTITTILALIGLAALALAATIILWAILMIPVLALCRAAATADDQATRTHTHTPGHDA